MARDRINIYAYSALFIVFPSLLSLIINKTLSQSLIFSDCQFPLCIYRYQSQCTVANRMLSNAEFGRDA